jgi:hypothetical protein
MAQYKNTYCFEFCGTGLWPQKTNYFMLFHVQEHFKSNILMIFHLFNL